MLRLNPLHDFKINYPQILQMDRFVHFSVVKGTTRFSCFDPIFSLFFARVENAHYSIARFTNLNERAVFVVHVLNGMLMALGPVTDGWAHRELAIKFRERDASPVAAINFSLDDVEREGRFH